MFRANVAKSTLMTSERLKFRLIKFKLQSNRFQKIHKLKKVYINIPNFRLHLIVINYF